MNYPVWELYGAGGGLFIALISVVHVFVAHFAVGGGLFLILTEKKAYREKSDDILAFTKRHALFFLLLTMVFGGITGVGIWFTIALISPAATSVLIHNFVFGWATEWVCFVGEIVALFVYYYTFSKMERNHHLTMGWLYFGFAWLSLFFVNGIIGFMLTPGKWVETHNFWDGFFNPSFWPSLCFRSALALVLAGIFGFISAVFIREETFRNHMSRYCARWLLVPFLFMAAFAGWYYRSLPPGPREMIMGQSPEIMAYTKIFLWAGPVLFLGGILMSLRLKPVFQKTTAFGVLFLGLLYMGSFEWIRESSRRPYLIYGHLYSTSIPVGDEQEIRKNGILNKARWIKNREITPETRITAGRQIFMLQCISCHSVNGPLNDILPLTAGLSKTGMDSRLTGQGKMNPYMPPFPGTPGEREALAAFIVEGLHGKQDKGRDIAIKPEDLSPLRFDPQQDDYVLLAWDPMGMHYDFDGREYFFLPMPANRIYAQLIRRNEIPEITTGGVEMRYVLEGNAGLEQGEEGSGNLVYDGGEGVFSSDVVKVTPYGKDGVYRPYPSVLIEARDKKNGRLLAQTRLIVPVTTEMGCNNCHGSQWKFRDRAGISDATAEDILGVHDRISKTNLLKDARKGKPRNCKSCHSEGLQPKHAASGALNLSAAIHGWHAHYLTGKGADACHMCHPSSPGGATRFFRGRHSRDFECTDCHGTLDDHAVSLLKGELNLGKSRAGRLMKHLKPGKADSIEQVNPRKPWINEPDCLSCHIRFDISKSEDFNAFNPKKSVIKLA
jgi:hypothetical protein